MDSLKKKIHEKEYNNEFSKNLLKFENHFHNIFLACNNSFQMGCGSYLFDGQNYKYQIETYNKQKILFEKSKNKKNILEIGTYMGHSLLIILMSNPTARITSIDIDDKYALPSINYLKKVFPKSRIKFLKGDSLKILKKLKEKYDLIHIDGAHKNKIVTKEFYHCMELIKNTNAEFVFDDKENIKTLIKNLFSIYNIIDHEFSRCIHGNFYAKISFPRNKQLFLYKKIFFVIKNKFSSISLKIKKLLKFMRL